MKYNHDSMLPIGAFKPRGSVVGGRSMRLHGGDGYMPSEEESRQMQLEHAQHLASQGYGQAMQDYSQQYSAPAPAPEPAPAPWSPPPEPAPVYNAPAPAPQGIASLPAAAPAAYTPFNVRQYGQTTDLENQYSYAANLANWQMERGRPDLAQQFIDQANSAKAQLDSPFRVDTITSGGGGDAGAAVPENVLVDRSGNIVSNVTPQDNGQFAVVAPGTGDAGASTVGGSFTLQDIIQQADSQKSAVFGAGMGQATGRPYELKNEDGEPYKRFDAQGNLTEFVDRLTGNWTKASDVKPVGTVFDPMQGKMVTEYEYGGNKFAPTESTGGLANAAFMDPYSKDTGGFMGEGGWARAGALVAAGLSAGLASGALVPGSIAAAGPGSASALGLSAAKGALTSMAVSGIQGATPAQMLKAGVLGGLGAGLGDFIGAAELGTAGNIAAKAGVQTGLTAIAGGNVQNALISSLINSTLPVVLNEALPPETSKILSGLPKSVQTVIMSTAGSVLNAGVTGKDISDAAVGGVTNGLISLGKDFAKGAFKDLSESELAQTVKNYLNPSYEEFQALPQDANATLDDVIRALPKTDTTASAKDPYSTDSILAALTEGYKNAPSTTGLPQYAGATTSDANPPSYGGDRYGAADTESPGGGDVSTLPEVSVNADEDSLRLYNEEMQKLGLPTAQSVNDANFISAVNRINNQTYNPDAPLDEPFKPQLPASEYDPVIKALEDAGLEVSYKTLDQFTQNPGALVDAVYPALAGRQPTEQERINFIDQYSNSATASPQDLLKDIYDQVQLDKQVPVYIDQSTSAPVPTPKPETPAPETKPKPPVPDEEVKKLIESSKTETTKLVSDLDSKIAANEEAGMERDAATDKAIEELAEATGKSDEEIKKLVADSQSVTEKLVSNIDAKIAANEKAGMNRDAATDKAIADLAKSTSMSDADLRNLIGTTAQAGQQYTQQQVANLQSTLSQQIAANEKSGLTRDQATDKAIADLAKSTGTSVSDLKNAIAGVNANVASSVSGLKSNLEALIAANETAGLSRDQATQNAINSLAASTGTSVSDLKNLISTTQAELAGAIGSSAQAGQQYTQAQIAGLQNTLSQQMAVNEATGMSRDQALSTAISSVAASLGTSTAALMGLIGEATGSLGSQIAGIGGGLSDLSSSFEAYQKEQEEKQAAAEKLQQQKQAAAAKQRARDQLISAMSQTQQVSAKTPPGAEIDYLYDIGGESIFAPMRSKTKQQSDQQYADGGLIENGSIEDLYALLRSI